MIVSQPRQADSPDDVQRVSSRSQKRCMRHCLGPDASQSPDVVDQGIRDPFLLRVDLCSHARPPTRRGFYPLGIRAGDRCAYKAGTELPAAFAGTRAELDTRTWRARVGYKPIVTSGQAPRTATNALAQAGILTHHQRDQILDCAERTPRAGNRLRADGTATYDNGPTCCVMTGLGTRSGRSITYRFRNSLQSSNRAPRVPRSECGPRLRPPEHQDGQLPGRLRLLPAVRPLQDRCRGRDAAQRRGNAGQSAPGKSQWRDHGSAWVQPGATRPGARSSTESSTWFAACGRLAWKLAARWACSAKTKPTAWRRRA